MVTREFWRGQPVFVTGHTGFKGGWLDHVARRHGRPRRPATRLQPAHHSPRTSRAAACADRVTTHIADVRDAARAAARRWPRPGRASSSTWPPSRSCACRTAHRSRRSRSTCWAPRHLLEARAPHALGRGGRGRHERQVLREPRARRKATARTSRSAATIPTAPARPPPSWWPPPTVARSSRRPGPASATVRAGNVIGGGDWAEDRLVPDAMRAPWCAASRSACATRPRCGRGSTCWSRCAATSCWPSGSAGSAARRRGPGTSVRATRTRCRWERWSS